MTDAFSTLQRVMIFSAICAITGAKTLSIITGDSITVDGTLGGEYITPVDINVNDVSTYGDLIEAINTAYRINNPNAAQVSGQDRWYKNRRRWRNKL
jgi:hypothetical protein